MKNSIKILATVGIIFLMSFTTYAQSNDWTGKWNTTLAERYTSKTLGELTITKSSNGEYIGVFPNGNIAGKMTPSGDLIGMYTRTVNSFDRTGMGKMGKFRFVMYADKKSFIGYYQVEGKDVWQNDNWNGKRPISLYGNIIEEQAAKKEFEKRDKALQDFLNKNKPAPIKSWTGTWETDLFGKLKIHEKNTANVVGKYRFQAYNNKITTGDLTGKVLKDNPGEFEGDFNDSDGKSGQIKIRYVNINNNNGYDFSGILIYNFTPEEKKMNIPLIKKIVDIKGHRVSSAQPSLINYN